MNDTPRPTDDYSAAKALIKALIEEKMAFGIFWPLTRPESDPGALSDARKLAWLLLTRGDILGALSLMIEVHAQALMWSEEILKSDPTDRMWRKWRNQSKRALWFYNKLERTLLFFGSL